MGDGFQFFDIILFALVAVFLALRLRSVLGRRTGNEQRRDPFAPPANQPPVNPAAAPSGNVVTLGDRNKVIDGTAAALDTSLPAELARLKAADPAFDPERFTTGARSAFEMIVNAFAAADVATLKPLLSPEVLQGFAQAIKERQDQKETLETTLLSIKRAEIVKAQIDRNIASVTVKFVSDQINVIRASDNSIVDGDPDRIVEKTDTWTFSRNTRSRDPNWLLVATHSD